MLSLAAALLLYGQGLVPGNLFGPLGACAQEPPAPPSPKPLPTYGVKVIKAYPHDPGAFTEGLVFLNGFLYESTGLNGKSSVRKVDLESGRVIKIHNLPAQYFGEGLTDWKGSLVQLTWRSGKGLIYNRETFAVEREFSYDTEGWGLTRDAKSIIMSNGSNKLIFLDPQTFARERVLEVSAGGKPVRLLNELEYVGDEILANIWQKDFIARISPKTGEVKGWIDLSELRKQLPKGSKAETLNGIAWDAEMKRLFVTGKLWPKLFEVEIVGEGAPQ